MSCEIKDLIPSKPCGDATNYKIYSIKDKTVYRDGKKYGEVLNFDNEDHSVDFMVTSDNKYTNGQIRRIYFQTPININR